MEIKLNNNEKKEKYHLYKLNNKIKNIEKELSKLKNEMVIKENESYSIIKENEKLKLQIMTIKKKLNRFEFNNKLLENNNNNLKFGISNSLIIIKESTYHIFNLHKQLEKLFDNFENGYKIEKFKLNNLKKKLEKGNNFIKYFKSLTCKDDKKLAKRIYEMFNKISDNLTASITEKYDSLLANLSIQKNNYISKDTSYNFSISKNDDSVNFYNENNIRFLFEEFMNIKKNQNQNKNSLRGKSNNYKEINSSYDSNFVDLKQKFNYKNSNFININNNYKNISNDSNLININIKNKKNYKDLNNSNYLNLNKKIVSINDSKIMKLSKNNEKEIKFEFNNSK